MADLWVDMEGLREFERGLYPRHPDKSAIPATILGYGEISTVLEIKSEKMRGMACKRLAMFKTQDEVDKYEAIYANYVQVLQERIGIQVVSSKNVHLIEGDRITGYIVQKKLPVESIGNRVIHNISADEVKRLVQAVLRETKKVYEFNDNHKAEVEIGFDAQISNWAVPGFDGSKSKLGEVIKLAYFDTSSPLLRRNGVEQLNPELFLRSAPSFLVWIIRLLFLEDVMTRYYDLRRVVVDLVANFYKEQLAELVPSLIETVNEFFTEEINVGVFKSLTIKEVKAYYREDALIWRIYLAFRKIDRSLHRLFGKEYAYILPEKVKR